MQVYQRLSRECILLQASWWTSALPGMGQAGGVRLYGASDLLCPRGALGPLLWSPTLTLLLL